MAAVEPYVLSSQILGHDKDVRRLRVGPGGEIISASLDFTLKVWESEFADSRNYVLKRSFIGHERYVYDMALREGILVSASADSTLIKWEYSSGNALVVLRGHDKEVSSVGFLANGDVVSGSWDGTVRVWHRDKNLTTAVLKQDGPVYGLTVCADDSVLVCVGNDVVRWLAGIRIATYTGGHSEVTRVVLDLPSMDGFLSAGRDGRIVFWNSEAKAVVSTMTGHSKIIYSLDAQSLQGGDLASGSGDNNAIVWRGGEPLQIVHLPSIVWAVAFLPSGDLVTGSADGFIRIWTLEAAKAAPPEEILMYEETLAASLVPENVVVHDKERLSRPGDHEGQVLVIKPNIAYLWSKGQWLMQGPVVAGPSDAGNTIAGEKFDVVFDVDLGESKPRKLGYNAGQDPYDVAYRWLKKQELSTDYLDQVAKFIKTNAAAITLGGDDGGSRGSGGFIDPLTGGGAYRAGSGSGGSGRGGVARPGMVADPLTGSGAYVAGTGQPMGAFDRSRGTKGDPLTGGLAYSTTSSGSKPSSTPSSSTPTTTTTTTTTTTSTTATTMATAARAGGKVPSLGTLEALHARYSLPVTFSAAADRGKILAKALELGRNQASWKEDTCGPVLEALAAAAGGGGGSSASPGATASQTEELLASLISMIESWSLASRFPLLDLFRCLVLQEPFVTALASRTEREQQTGAPNVVASIVCPNVVPAAPVPVRMLALRTVANLLSAPSLHQSVVDTCGAVLDAMAEVSLRSSSVPERTAAATVLLNLSYTLAPGSAASSLLLLATVSGLCDGLGWEVEEDVLFRLAAGAETALTRFGDEAAEAFVALGGEDGLRTVAKRTGEAALAAERALALLHTHTASNTSGGGGGGSSSSA